MATKKTSLDQKLWDACSQGDFDTVEKAVENGANVNVGISGFRLIIIEFVSSLLYPSKFAVCKWFLCHTLFFSLKVMAL